jgi:histone H3/H4
MIAPVVQAPQNAGQGQVKGLIVECVHEVVKTAGQEIGKYAVAAWT